MSKKNKKAIVLLSGGLDSATTLAIASENYQCYSVSFNYGQRSLSEIQAAKKLAKIYQSQFLKVTIDKAIMSGSALTDVSIDVPEQYTEGIPVTYVPARNTLFLSYALALAEVHHASAIFIGVNSVDYSGYPDCRPDYINAYQLMANLATKAAVEGDKVTINTPLINKTKSQIIQTGIKLGIDYSLSVSCYKADEQGRACGQCDSCRLRKAGFEQAKVIDPTRYI